MDRLADGYLMDMANEPNSTTVPPPTTPTQADDMEEVTLTAVLHMYADGGFAGLFGVTADGLVDCSTCSTESRPSAVEMHSIRRLEGASDPDDTLAVAAITCPVCGTRGTLTLQYGPMADLNDSDVLLALQDNRAGDVAPPDSAPGEMSVNGGRTSDHRRFGNGEVDEETSVDPIDEDAAHIDARSAEAPEQIEALVEHAESLGRDAESPIG